MRAATATPRGISTLRWVSTSASTAEAATLLRAAGALIADPALRGPDTLAGRFIPWSTRASALVKVPGLRLLLLAALRRRMPGALWFEVVRTRHMDAVVAAEVAAGARQVVVLGAGLDSRPYRMDLAGASVYEVDHPAMSAVKRRRLRAVFGSVPPGVRYATADLEADGLAESLAGCGFDPAARTVAVLSGVAPYLSPEGVDRTLRWVATLGRGSAVVFDYCWQEVIDGDTRHADALDVVRWVAARGEPWRSGIPEGGVAAYLAERGLHLAEDLAIPDARDRHLPGSGVPVWEFGAFATARVR